MNFSEFSAGTVGPSSGVRLARGNLLDCDKQGNEEISTSALVVLVSIM